MTRCFLAFEFTPESLDYLEHRIAPAHRLLSEDQGWPLRLIRPGNWHVTLLYFEGLQAPERRLVWEQVERGVSEEGWRPPQFSWQGLRLWPSPRRPSLICLEAAPAVASVAWPLQVASEPCVKGNVAHYLAYRPHATVMRFRGRGSRKPLGREWRELEGALPGFDATQIHCDRVSMFLSTLTQEQPVYPREFSLALPRN